MNKILIALASFITLNTALGVTYFGEVKPILDGHCIDCHDGGGHDPDLTSFPFISKTLPSQPAIVNKILEKLEASPPAMPPGNRPKLGLAEVTTIQEWLDGGLQQ